MLYTINNVLDQEEGYPSPTLAVPLSPQYDLAPGPMPPPFPPEYPPLPQEDMDLSSEPESEYDSGDGDENKER